jgi:subtilisin family serine protease
MKRWPSIRLLFATSVALTFLSCGDAARLVQTGSGEQISAAQPQLTRNLTRTLDEPLTVWVVMKPEADLTRAVSTNWIARGREVVRELTTTAAASQASLIAYLSTRGVRFQSYWIVNTLKVTADRNTIAEIGRRPDVKTIVPDKSYSLPPIRPGRPQPGVQTVEWGVANVRAPEVWSTFGARGDGIVVANIDTGVQFDHPALVAQYRGNNGGSFDHNYNWFDPAKICPPGTPCDNNAHGTHTMGSMVGDDGNPGVNQIGVAPKAKWIAAKGCESSGCSTESLLASGQWIAAPTDLNGMNPSPEKRPHIVNNSWGGGGGDIFYQEIVQSWIAAGIFPAFASGNSGPSCGSTGSPGDYGISYAVGAHDIMNVIAPFSSRGPSPFDGITKPNISAPGANVRSSTPGNSYDSFSGTSMATPHLAGVVALIWSAAPSLIGDITGTRALLDQTAIDTEDLSCGGTAQNNNVFGEGRVDAFAATEQAPRGPTGTLTGTVTVAGGGPLANATISAEGPTKRRTLTDAAGNYTLLLPVGEYAVTASAFGYVSQTVTGVVITEGATTTANFALTAAPSATVSGTVTDNTGAPVSGGKVTILGTPIPPAVTDAAGKYTFAGVPHGTYEVRAEGTRCLDAQTKSLTVDGDETLDFTLSERQDAFGYKCKGVAASFIDGDTVLPLVGDLVSVNIPLPFPVTLYGQSYESATVTPKGYIEFLTGGPVNYINEAIPNANRPNAAIYAFWDDMVVDSSSSVRTGLVGTAPNRQFVIEWRDVSFFDAPQLRVRFEMVLAESGEITFQYAAPTDDARQRGASATIGLENESGTVAFQYSNNEPTVEAGSAIQFFLPPSGFVEGTVTDANDGKPVSGIEVQALQNGAPVRSAKTNSAGRYRMQLPVGSYVIAAGSAGYGRQEVPVTVTTGATVTVNFSLQTARAEVKPSTVELVVTADQVRKRILTLRNTGSLNLEFEIAESGGKVQSVVSTASLLRRDGADPNAINTRGLYQPGIRVAGWTPSAPGNIIRSFTPTGMTLAWGVGYSGPVWLSDAQTNKNAEFTVEGAATGRGYDTPWTGGWGADMAYDAKRGRVCQLGVGMGPDQNGIHCWDPATGQVTDTVTGTWAGTSQRGLAYREDDDSFYVGGWNEGIVYHVKGLSHPDKGAVIGQCKPSDGGISGLAWNGAAGVLWASTNSPTDSIYELNAEDCTVLAVLPHPTPGGFQGGGLEMDENGDLWTIAQNPNKVFLVESGVPAFNDVSWLSVAPTRGTVAPGGSTQLTVTVDTKGLAVGTYLASIFVVSNSAREGRLRIPVSLVVTDYQQGVNAGGSNYKDKAGDTWSADKKHSQGSWGYIQTSSTKSTSHSIKGTSDPKLFQSQRVDPYAYRFDNVPNGIYQVDLRFAEFENLAPGRRVFDVVVENTLVLPAHDIIYEVGRFAADAKTFFVEVIDGRADIRLIPRAGFQKPVINALRITRRPDR